jgi:uncharacterized protein YrrD
MIKGDYVIGKQVVTLNDGKKIEKVHDIIFDHTQNTVLGFVVDEGGWFSNARVLPLAQVKAIGEDAVLIQDVSAIISAEESPKMNSILQGDNVLKGTKVMTDDGKELGTMVDLSFDPATGMVEGYEVSGGLFADAYSGRAMVPAPETLTIGKDVAFVPASTAVKMEEQAGGIKAAMQSAGGKLQEIQATASEKGKAMVDKMSSKGQEISGKATSPEVKSKVMSGADSVKEAAVNVWDKVKQKASEVKDKAGQEIEDHRINGALGKPVNRVIFDKSDAVILNMGDIITHKAVEAAREAGELDVLLDSVYSHEPKILPEHMKASEPHKEKV